MYLKKVFFVGVACLVLVTGGCGSPKIVDQVKNTAESKVTSLAGTALQMKDNASYAKFMVLRPGMSFKAAMATMIALPDKESGIELMPHKACAWNQDDGSVITCLFLEDKLFTKEYSTKNITLKRPFTVEQFNEISNNDSYDTIKKKLDNQDGYISSVTLVPGNEKRDTKEIEQTTYTWRNPDGTAIEVQFMEFMGLKSSKKKLTGSQAGTGDNGAKPGTQSQANTQQPMSSNSNSNVQSFNPSAISSAGQSSFDNEDGYYHDAAKAIDGDIKSCWAEGVKGLGIGEYIQVGFNGTYRLRGLNIWTGHQKTQDLFYKNARPVAIRVIGSDGSNEVYGLNDMMGMQRVNFRTPINVNSVKIVIDKIVRGNKYEDTCIAEVSFF